MGMSAVLPSSTPTYRRLRVAQGFATLHVPEGVAVQPNVLIQMVHAEAIRTTRVSSVCPLHALDKQHCAGAPESKTLCGCAALTLQES